MDQALGAGVTVIVASLRSEWMRHSVFMALSQAV
jgi:hypothetical protein